MNEEIKFLREHIKDICSYKGLQEELTYDISVDILKRICIAFDYLQQENEQLKKMVNFGGITIVNCPECNKEINVNFCRETEEYRKKYQVSNDNWNKLKEYLEENLYFYSGYQGEDREEDLSIKYALEKMNELEKGNNNEL